MGTYMVINKHRPEECLPMDAGIARLSPRLRGQPFYCPCPFGEHGFYMLIEGTSSDDVIGQLPVDWRPGTRAVPMEVFRLPE
jgi:hypothetical protein